MTFFLTLIDFNPRMDEYQHPLLSVGLNHLSFTAFNGAGVEMLVKVVICMEFHHTLY